jgi:putative phosphoesterase
MSHSLRIFVLADTHDRLPSTLDELAEGADEIWHLGDVCAESVLDQIRGIGPPVMVVRGNCDGSSEWPVVLDLVRNNLRFRLQHIPPDRPPDDDCDVLMHAHTHVPRNEVVGRVRFLNPGCVTRPNRGAAPSVAFLEISADEKLRWQLKTLP